MTTARAAGGDGFTLLEVLVALAIMSVAFAVLLGIFSQSLSEARALRDREAARALAQAIMAEQGTVFPVAFGTATGQDGAFAWDTQTAPYIITDGDTLRLASVAIRVRWDGGRRTLMLRTLLPLPKTETR